MPALERALEGREPVASAAEPELTPEAALAAAEAELASATALRKATQRRVRELEKREARMKTARDAAKRSEEHTSELQSRGHLVCRLLLEKKKQKQKTVNEKKRALKTMSQRQGRD